MLIMKTDHVGTTGFTLLDYLDYLETSPFLRNPQVLSWFTRPLAICSGPWNRRIIAPLPKTWPCRAKATFLSTTTSEIFAFTASMENFWGKFLPNCRNIDLLIMFLCSNVLWLCPEMPWSGLLSGLGVSVLIQRSNNKFSSSHIPERQYLRLIVV